MQIKIENNIYKLANNWQELTVGQYITFINIQKDEHLHDIHKVIKIISSISTTPKELENELLKLSLQDLKQLENIFNWLFENNSALLENNEILSDVIIVGGKQYKVKDYHKIEIGEFITFESLLSEKQLDPIEIAIPILFREINEDKTEKALSLELIYDTIKTFSDNAKIIDIYKHIDFFLSSDKNTSLSNIRIISDEK